MIVYCQEALPSNRKRSWDMADCLFICFLVFFSFCSVYKPLLAHFTLLNLQMSIESTVQKLNIFNVTGIYLLVSNEICRKQERSDWCELEGEIRINENQSTVFVVSSQQYIQSSYNYNTWRIRPYARKGAQEAMDNVREWSIQRILDSDPPECSQTRSIPAVLFSLGGLYENNFHTFTDIIIPLYSASHRFNGTVQFVVTNYSPWWVSKFGRILNALSNYEIMDADKINDVIYCFRSITIGLPRYTSKELTVEPSLIPQNSVKHFREFLRSLYSLQKITAIKINNMTQKEKPRLVIISRKRTRAFTDVDSVAKMAKQLGFEVVVYEPEGDVLKTAQIMNSCDVVLGVHGAGLTNMVFLPENAILIQVVPFGGAEWVWVSKIYFEEPTKEMNVRYLEYRISINESSLVQNYPPDHVVLRNPDAIQRQGYKAFKSIYFDKQNVTLDLNRFRPTLVKALELLRH